MIVLAIVLSISRRHIVAVAVVVAVTVAAIIVIRGYRFPLVTVDGGIDFGCMAARSDLLLMLSGPAHVPLRKQIRQLRIPDPIQKKSSVVAFLASFIAEL